MRSLVTDDIPRILRLMQQPKALTVLGFKPSAGDILRHIWNDPDFNPTYALGVGDPLKGFVLGVRRPWKQDRDTTGFIKWLQVCDDAPTDAAASLLSGAMAAMRADGADRFEYGASSPAYLVPGVPEGDTRLLCHLRDTGWTSSSQRISLSARIPPDFSGSSLPHDICLSVATPADESAALHFVKREFGASWSVEIRTAFNPALPAVCSLARKEGRIIGFAAMHAGNPNWFGPMGVHPACRGQGIGSDLAGHVLSEAYRRGTERVLFSWVNEKEAFYRHLLPHADTLRFHKLQKGP